MILEAARAVWRALSGCFRRQVEDEIDRVVDRAIEQYEQKHPHSDSGCFSPPPITITVNVDTPPAREKQDHKEQEPPYVRLNFTNQALRLNEV